VQDALRQTKHQTYAAAASTAITFPTSVVSGDLIVVYVNIATLTGQLPASLTDSQGNTYTLGQSDGGDPNNFDHAMYWATASASGALTVTATWTTHAAVNMAVFELNNALPGGGLSTGTFWSSATNPPTNPITDSGPYTPTAQAIGLVVAAINSNSAITISDGSKVAFSAPATALSLDAFYNIVPATAQLPLINCGNNAAATMSEAIGQAFNLSAPLGALPPGLVLNPNTGAITGTPTAPGVYTFFVVATDATGAIGTSSMLTIQVQIVQPTRTTSNNLQEIEVACLPEGKRIFTATVDFSSVPPTPLPSAPPYLNFPECTINDNSADGPGHDASLACTQVVNLNPGSGSQPSNAQAVGLSVIRSLQFYYRPSFGCDGVNTAEGPADFAAIPDEIGLLLVTNVQTQQTVVIPAWPAYGGGNPQYNTVVNGAVPFYASPNDTIRVLKLNEGNAALTGSGYGKVTLQFANFDIPPYLTIAIPTVDAN
jgi:hypothetical protein